MGHPVDDQSGDQAEVAMRVRRLRAEEWETLRALRLRALADAPEAFARTHAEEAAHPEELWRRRAADGPDVVTLIAERDPRGPARRRGRRPWSGPGGRRDGDGATGGRAAPRAPAGHSVLPR